VVARPVRRDSEFVHEVHCRQCVFRPVPRSVIGAR
jgi:hypothetical protein